MTATSPLRRGATLVELLVVLAILGVLAGVAGLRVASAPRLRESDPAAASLAEARATAIATGRVITVDIRTDGGPRRASALPDGSVIADSAFGINRLTGRSAP